MAQAQLTSEAAAPAADRRRLTGVERTFDPSEIIVSKTDLRGRITYANQVFLRVAQFEEHELLGQPHSIVRHPGMPRCVFKFLWDTIRAGQEVFAYVINRAKSGDHYWVYAHVTPTFDDKGEIISFHSSRRSPNRRAVDRIVPIYQLLCREEAKHSHPAEACRGSLPLLVDFLAKQKKTYEEFVFSL